MKYSKIEIAIHSLITAKDFHQKGDYIISTILSGPAQQVLRDLCKSRNIEPVIKTISNKSGHSEKDIHEMLVETYNGMKHADKDPEASVEVLEAISRSLMTVAATDLMRLNEIKSKDISDFVDYVKSIKDDSV